MTRRIGNSLSAPCTGRFTTRFDMDCLFKFHKRRIQSHLPIRPPEGGYRSPLPPSHILHKCHLHYLTVSSLNAIIKNIPREFYGRSVGLISKKFSISGFWLHHPNHSVLHDSWIPSCNQHKKWYSLTC